MTRPAIQRQYDAPPPPPEGQMFIDGSGAFWKVQRLTVTDNPAGFYLVHLCYGATLDTMDDSMVLGPREFAALSRERDLRAQRRAI